MLELIAVLRHPFNGANLTQQQIDAVASIEKELEALKEKP